MFWKWSDMRSRIRWSTQKPYIFKSQWEVESSKHPLEHAHGPLQTILMSRINRTIRNAVRTVRCNSRVKNRLFAVISTAKWCRCSSLRENWKRFVNFTREKVLRDYLFSNRPFQLSEISFSKSGDCRFSLFFAKVR